MQRSKQSLGLLKGILDSYHQPPPIDKKEKQKLYNLLTTSFRRHLDQEHGWPADQPPAAQQTHAAKKLKEASNPATSSSVTEVAGSPLARQPAPHEHLRSILTNPLFSYNASKPRVLWLQEERDPMDIFEEAVAKGLMTPLRAAGCLKAKHHQITKSSAMDPVAAMASSSAGHQVVEWLRSSGLERDLGFLDEAWPLVGQLVPFLVAEKMETKIWDWLDMLSKDSNGLQKVDRENQRTLLFQSLVESKLKGATSMDDAYSCLKQARETFPWSPEDIPPKYIMAAWRKVTWESTVMAWKYLSKASPRLFDYFFGIGSDYLDFQRQQAKIVKPRYGVETRYGVEMAHLALHHPTHPHTQYALKLLLDNDKIWENWDRQRKKTQELRVAPSKSTIRLRSFGLDTVRLCARQGRVQQVERLMDKMAPFLERDFNLSSDDVGFDELGSPNTPVF